MTIRNYDTTTGMPFPRISELTITEGTDGTVHVEYLEEMAMLQSDGKVVLLREGAARHKFALSEITQPVPLEDPVTGQVIPGQTTTAPEARLKLFAFIRAHQRMLDAQRAQQAAPAAPTAE